MEFLKGKFVDKGPRSLLTRLHRDEQGAVSVEFLLIVVVIVLPLLGIIILYRDKLTTWVGEIWEKMVGKAGTGSGFEGLQ